MIATVLGLLAIAMALAVTYPLGRFCARRWSLPLDEPIFHVCAAILGFTIVAFVVLLCSIAHLLGESILR